MAVTMKAAVVHEFGAPLVIEDVPIPEPGPGQILVKLEACGVCHTDLHASRGEWPVKPKLPFIPGHEGVGHVVKLGPGARVVKEGDRVGIAYLHTACGECEYCRTGWETLCAKQQISGYTVNGSFAEYALADPLFVGRLPESLDAGIAAPVLCAGVTVYKGLKETEVRPGEWVAVLGIGGLGHMALQYARAMGMRVIAVTTHPEKGKLALELGADLVVDARKDPAVEVQKAVGGVHGVLVTAVSKSLEAAYGMMRSKGTVVMVGIPPGDFSLPVFDTVVRRLTLRGSIVGTRQDLAEAIDFAVRGKVVTHYEWGQLQDINKIFERMATNKLEGRIVLRF